MDEMHTQDGTDPVSEALGSGDAARHVAHLTGMSADSARTYAAFHSGRWALEHPEVEHRRAA
jgi:hypothetical protein